MVSKKIRITFAVVAWVSIISMIVGIIFGIDTLAIGGLLILLILVAMVAYLRRGSRSERKARQVVEEVVQKFIDDMEHHRIPPSHCKICGYDFPWFNFLDHFHNRDNSKHIEILYNAQPIVVKVWDADCSLCHLRGSIREFEDGMQIPIFDGSKCPRGKHNWIPRELIWAKLQED